ncbi:MAG: NAD(P)/FAD-dependent oxidoreductase [Microthrixaceae bacterium]|nr:NAD(P)/FAD-dependent oxidoreductase [Microthrixaceae bacterium]
MRDNRNPIVSCVVDPFAGHETTDSMPSGPVAISREVLVVGAGPAGMEAARVAATQGHSVRMEERAERPGGMLHATAASLVVTASACSPDGWRPSAGSWAWRFVQEPKSISSGRRRLNA